MNTTNRLKLPVAMSVIVLSIGACGSGSDTADSDIAGDSSAVLNESVLNAGDQQSVFTTEIEPDVANPDSAIALDGTWDQCGGTLRNTYVFQGDTWALYTVIFEFDGCQGDVVSVDLPTDEPLFSGTFNFAGETTTESGLIARNIDFLTTRAYNVAVTIVDQGEFASSTNLETLDILSYDIVYNGTLGELIFGNGSGNSPEQRPTSLTFELPFVRRE